MPEPDAPVDGPFNADQAPRHSFLIRLRQSRPTIPHTLATSAATILLMAAATLTWRFYDAWRQGQIELTTVDAPVVAQVLAESTDTPIGEPFDLVTRAVVSLPAGDYRLHVSGKGRLSRTYRFGVTRGETQTHEISLDEGRLLGGERSVGFGGDERARDVPIRFPPFITSLGLTKGKSDLIEWSGDSVVRRDGATGEVHWDTLHPALPFRPNHDPAPWIRDYSGEDEGTRIVELAPDLNGDGTGDLLWFFPGTSAFLAQSGENGSMLWNCAAGLDEKGGFQATGLDLNRMDTERLITGQIIGVPALADIDRDGAPDLIATIIFAELDDDAARRRQAKSPGVLAVQPEIFHCRLVMAISSRSGRALWTYPLDQAFADVPRESWERPSVLVQGRHRALVAVLDGAQWLGLDLATGRPQAGPFPLGFSPIRRLKHADLDGDGEPEILALDLRPGGGQNTLHAFSIKTGRELWAEKVGATYDIARYAGATPDFPMTADLDDDGRAEIVVADSGLMPPLAGYRGVKLLEGRTGKPRWRHPMRPDTVANDGPIEAIAAPDLDGDGTRDLITISLYCGKNLPTAPRALPQEPALAYVDAISGKDGRPLWLWHIELPVRKFTRIWPLHWWGRGHDGWPLLAVPLGGSRPDGAERNYGRSVLSPPVVHLLEASTGIERHTVDGLSRPRFADLDGDGLADLWGEVDGELRAFRGEAPEAWRALGRFDPANSSNGEDDYIRGPSVDFDGDGVADTMIRTARGSNDWPQFPAFSRTAQVRSGRDGHVIWTTTLDPAESWLGPGRTDRYYFTAFSPPEGDLDGDGTPDVFVLRPVPPSRPAVFKQNATLPVQVLSGRTGDSLVAGRPASPRLRRARLLAGPLAQSRRSRARRRARSVRAPRQPVREARLSSAGAQDPCLIGPAQSGADFRTRRPRPLEHSFGRRCASRRQSRRSLERIRRFKR